MRLGVGLVKWRFAWPAIVILVLMPVAIRIAMFRGLFRPLLLASESMAPTLWGPSSSIHCDGCGILLRWAISRDKPPAYVTCFNCGTRSGTQTAEFATGNRVLVDRAAYWFSMPQRWDLVAFNAKDGSLAVKRLLGLPGDQIGFLHGDLYDHGQPIRRSLRQALSAAIPVNDDQYRKSNISRWQCPSPEAWTQTPAGFEYSVSDSTSPPLVYHHRQVYQNNRPEQVRDDYPGNQQISREMVPVDDLIVQLQCAASDGTELDIAIWVRGQVIGVHLLRESKAWKTLDETAAVANHWPAAGDASDVLTVAHIDGHLWVAIGNKHQVVQPSPSQRWDKITLDATKPIAVACRSPTSPVAIRNLRVARDLHWWYRADGKDWTADAELSSESYFVVGDNVPGSLDSRDRQQPVTREHLTGRVVPYNR